MQQIFSNISSVTNIRSVQRTENISLIRQKIFQDMKYFRFVPRTARDKDYLLVTEDIEKFGCGCCSIGLGE